MKGYRMNDEERRLWILNDEGLYDWWRSSKQPLKSFIKENRDELTKLINSIAHDPLLQYVRRREQ